MVMSIYNIKEYSDNYLKKHLEDYANIVKV